VKLREERNSLIKSARSYWPVSPLNSETSQNVGKLSTISWTSFTALPLHWAITFTKLPSNFYMHTQTHTHTLLLSRWFGHVERKDDNDWVKRCIAWEI